MVKPLTFKGDKKVKKRKRTTAEDDDANSKVARTEEEVENDDSWLSADVVTDISGPTMFVLPTTPPSALSCDVTGKVFTIPIENIVDGNASSAEPHDVRQVWVTSKIPGTDHYRFKSHHGKYLSCDKFGIFSATSEAVSPLETFVLAESPEKPGTFQIQTLRETYLTVSEPSSTSKSTAPEVRGDATEPGPETTLHVRMQARFKPRNKAAKEEKALQKVSRSQLEEAVGRKLEDDEVKRLKKARREGDYHEVLLDMKTKNKHDKYG
ncbi:FRG1-like family-domain-containing protein [Coniochaeta sp. 2T2.1]|nr:FRG1-like family-domain-containing protein [Coniochaeta sp. 2T2.1]